MNHGRRPNLKVLFAVFSAITNDFLPGVFKGKIRAEHYSCEYYIEE